MDLLFSQTKSPAQRLALRQNLLDFYPNDRKTICYFHEASTSQESQPGCSDFVTSPPPCKPTPSTRTRQDENASLKHSITSSYDWLSFVTIVLDVEEVVRKNITTLQKDPRAKPAGDLLIKFYDVIDSLNWLDQRNFDQKLNATRDAKRSKPRVLRFGLSKNRFMLTTMNISTIPRQLHHPLGRNQEKTFS
jgi:hypothetical protein